jgi:hypothetical protein
MGWTPSNIPKPATKEEKLRLCADVFLGVTLFFQRLLQPKFEEHNFACAVFQHLYPHYPLSPISFFLYPLRWQVMTSTMCWGAPRVQPKHGGHDPAKQSLNLDIGDNFNHFLGL